MSSNVPLDNAKMVFSHIDADNDGHISRLEIQRAFALLKLPMSNHTLDSLMTAADHNGDGRIDFTEFEAFHMARIKELQVAYDFFLSEGGNYQPLSTSALRDVVKRLNLKASDSEIRGMIQLMDRNSDGVVTFEEFRDYLLLLPAVNPRAVFDYWRSQVHVDDAEFASPKDSVVQGAYSDGVVRLGSGALAGAVSRTSTAPIDRLKTIMQMGGAMAIPGAQSGGAARVGGMMDSIRFIYAEGGARAFYRGNGANVMKIAPETGMKFLAYDWFKETIAQDPTNVTVWERFAAGGMAGATSQFAIYPLEIAKTRLSVSPPGTYSGVGHCIGSIARFEGLKNLYAGLGASVMGIIPYAGVDLAMNSILKEVVSEHYSQKNEEPGVAALLGCGMASSTTAMLATYPLGLIRTRLQAGGMKGTVQYNGFFDCFTKILQADGPRGLYKGLVPNAMK
eukprot:gene11178-13209_t